MNTRGSRIVRGVIFPLVCLVFFVVVAVKVQAAGTGIAVFDNPGASIQELVQKLRRAASFLPGVEPSAPTPQKPVPPVVVTVSGMRMGEIDIGIKIKYILMVWNWIFPDRRMDPDYVAEQIKRMDAEEREIGIEEAPSTPNDVELSLRVAAAAQKIDLEVINFAWDQAPGDSDKTIELFKAQLLAAYQHSRERGAPLYIVAHSWGTVLMHDVLQRLEKEHSPVQVDRFVTMGSPLVPQAWFVRLFKDIENIKEGLQRRVSKPKNVKCWVNLWASLDPYSSDITVADQNLQVDTQALPYIQKLLALQPTFPDPKMIKQDLKVFRSANSWHKSYYRKFKSVFKSLNQEVDWDVLHDQLGAVLPSQS